MAVTHPYPRLARRAVTTHLARGPLTEALWADLAEIPELLTTRQAAFVSIKTSRGELRGCIGTIAPAQPSLAWEIALNAISAAVHDPRFSPLTADELPGVVFSVDVLSPPEIIKGPEQLDPARYGVIVSRGGRRGLLLPALEGVDTVEEQLAIAARKAGLDSPTDLKLERFTVTRFPEGEVHDPH
ncbi:MAG: AmmeMemoRadiSam system protein A [Candidatus Adiutrix sp.]|jgi:AmmeMemoRadiSam system protein A|nr:AmmeMemoRadiSam system protein A [Candidatus Adiutrix sp.]